MAKRIKAYPPSGGEPIEIYAEDLASFEAKGWRAEAPRESKKVVKKLTTKQTPDEETE